ncbi:MAG: AFG1 family ATPase [Rhodospirillales bacterium]|nr:AFG1 family ATPase [Rhodospirillales bacterium]
MRAAGTLAADPAQTRIAARLDALYTALIGYDPKPPAPPGLLGRLFGRATPQPAPRGLYLVGEVGRGKSMLMDLFFDTARVTRKQRIHFHQFMQDAHARIFAWKQAHPETEDPIPPLADAIAAEAALLCFDEFQVNDIADAMILGRLFQALFDRAVVVVATSNVAPDQLFAGQPGRDAFLPFIALIQQHLELVVMDDGQDYRRHRLHGSTMWHVPADGRADAALDAAFRAMSGGATPRPLALTVNGRRLEVPLAAGGVARFDFPALCAQPLGAGDYLAIAKRFHTLVLDAIPRLSPDNFDEARRFIVLVDALYDHRVKLVASAAAEPDGLYRAGDGAKMFERTASRLEEMQSADWLAHPHII